MDKDNDKELPRGIATAVAGTFIDSTTTTKSETDWIPIAKVGQAMQISGDVPNMPEELFTTAKGFELGVTLFNEIGLAGYVSRNHAEIVEGPKMIEQKFEDPFLYAKFNKEGQKAIKNPKLNGQSIDATIFAFDGTQATHFLVPGVSMLDGEHTPACTPQMGCAEVPLKDKQESVEINIPKKGEGESEYHKGGGIEKMEEEGKVEVVTYTGEQTKEMMATAVSEATEKLGNEHAVELTKLKDEEEARVKEAEEAHKKAIKMAGEEAFKRAQARATFMQKFSLKDDSEVMKQYDGVKTVMDMQTLVNTMEIPMATPVAAGISSAAGEQPEVPKEEVLGAWDPVKGEFSKAYRRGE